ncbi:concanavalin A-like lectin/glucanase domain-containing protein [Gigaspora rosea]|uniref:Concanavalin A-like lectin/glucanase domain-containing protein n=1 Tax=Gigaspora rosea TaxID=44941 RepID=A0A397V9P8_9GLOM|nr:concanavalin A-like lectin/glucanase domain-containing protein [Gigaspora rosea]
MHYHDANNVLISLLNSKLFLLTDWLKYILSLRIIAIGFCTKSAELNKLPGCGKDSWGYHSDDGNFFDCSEIEEPYGPTFKTGDTIGCCLDFRNNTVFYTKNGINLGIVFRDLKYNELHEKKDKKDLENDLYYLCIGIRPKNGPIFIEANFGHKEFKYSAITDNDIDNDQLKEKWIKALEQCDSEDKDMIEVIKSLGINQNNTFALRYSAKAYFIIGKYDKTLKLLTELLENEPDNASALRYRGEPYLILNKYVESSVDVNKLLEINKDDEWALKASNEVDRR